MALRCEILSTGDEVVTGQIVDTNAAWLLGQTAPPRMADGGALPRLRRLRIHRTLLERGLRSRRRRSGLPSRAGDVRSDHGVPGRARLCHLGGNARLQPIPSSRPDALDVDRGLSPRRLADAARGKRPATAR